MVNFFEKCKCKDQEREEPRHTRAVGRFENSWGGGGVVMWWAQFALLPLI